MATFNTLPETGSIALETLETPVKKTNRRVLLKLSGEALMGTQDFGICDQMMNSVVEALMNVAQQGVQIGVVVGGGNLFRGVQGTASGMNPTRADGMGMMATIMNGLALLDALERAGQVTRAFCAIEMPRIMELFRRDVANEALNAGSICIFAGGTGNPFFTTDSAAALRAAELNADEVIKGTQVDGVYEADPRYHPEARRYQQVSFSTCLQHQLKVMDAAAFAICQSAKINVRVFNMHRKGSLAQALLGEVPGTLVGVGLTDQFA